MHEKEYGNVLSISQINMNKQHYHSRLMNTEIKRKSQLLVSVWIVLSRKLMELVSILINHHKIKLEYLNTHSSI